MSRGCFFSGMAYNLNMTEKYHCQYFRKGFIMNVSEKTWRKAENNPVLRWDDWGTMFDPSIVLDNPPFPRYRLYFSWRPQNSIAVVESSDSATWSKPRIVLGAIPRENDAERSLNRQSVLKKDGIYHMYYSGQGYPGKEQHAWIFHAFSKDGYCWNRDPECMIGGDFEWECCGIMCPHVIYEPEKKRFRMWYSAMSNPGIHYEPDCIGYAESSDGTRWSKPYNKPVFHASDVTGASLTRVTAAQILPYDNLYYMFYIGFTSDSYAEIRMARSTDGINGWEDYPGNPIVTPDEDSWDADACYKPTVCFNGKNWLLWYNGRRGTREQIGLAIHDTTDLCEKE